MRYISLILLLVWATAAAQAQSYSYVYIQGDKQIPFYVKLEGEMLPRYGKNYCIIPRLEPGVINVDILFQQNAYPAQHFVIKVPENGSRGFYLNQKNGSFSLYDLQQQFYLPAGNTEADDHAPDNTSIAAAPQETATKHEEPAAATQVQEQPNPPKAAKSRNVKARVKTPPAATPAAKAETVHPGQPNFIGDIELNNDHSVQPARTSAQDRAIAADAARKADSVLHAMQQEKNDTSAAQVPATETAPPAADTVAAIPNSDCPAPIDDEQFEQVYKKTLQQNEEEDRLDYLSAQMGNCYTTAQAELLARSMDSDAARFTFLKKIYPRITDQSKFTSLQSLLSTDQWRGHFLEIVKQPAK